MPPWCEDGLAHLLEVVVENGDDVLGRHVLGARREPTEVGEHDRRHQFLALETEIGVGLRQYLVDDLFRHEAREDIAHALALEGRERVVRADRAHGRHQEGGGRIDVGRHASALLERELRAE